MVHFRPTPRGPHPRALESVLRRVAERPASRAGAAVLARALELGISPVATAHWIRTQGAAPAPLRELAGDRRRWQSLTRDVARHRRESRDPRRTAEKAVAWMLAPRPEALTAEQHRLALTVVAVVALRTAGPAVEGWGDAAYMGGGDLGLELGVSEWAARARLAHAVALGALDRRSAAPSGVAGRLRITRAPREVWQVTQTPAVRTIVDAIVAGERTALDAIVHPALAYGGVLTTDAAILTLLSDAGVDPHTRGFSGSVLARTRRALRDAGVTDTQSLLAHLDAAGTGADERAMAVERRRAQADSRTREIARYQVAGKAAAKVDYASAYQAARHVVPIVLAALDEHGRPGERGGDELRAWVDAMADFFASHSLTPAEVAGAAALLARACPGRDRTEAQNAQLAQLAVEGVPA